MISEQRVFEIVEITGLALGIYAVWDKISNNIQKLQNYLANRSIKTIDDRIDRLERSIIALSSYLENTALHVVVWCISILSIQLLVATTLIISEVDDSSPKREFNSDVSFAIQALFFISIARVRAFGRPKSNNKQIERYKKSIHQLKNTRLVKVGKGYL